MEDHGHVQILSTILSRLPQAVVVTCLGVAGVNTVSIQLVNLSLTYLSVMTAPGLAIPVWWMSTAFGGLMGVLLCVFFEFWAVNRGFKAWSILAWDEGNLLTPSWRSVWWWILLSGITLVSSFVVSAVLQNILF